MLYAWTKDIDNKECAPLVSFKISVPYGKGYYGDMHHVCYQTMDNILNRYLTLPILAGMSSSTSKCYVFSQLKFGSSVSESCPLEATLCQETASYSTTM